MKYFLLLIAILYFQINCDAQSKLKAGYDLKQAEDMLLLSVKYFYAKETASLPLPQNYDLKYTSENIGFDNKWSFYYNEQQKLGVIAIRGTTNDELSFLANMYAAMVPAQGTIKLSENEMLHYKLSNHTQAAVHVGWLIGCNIILKEALPLISEFSSKGMQDLILTGHSQGGAIATMLTAQLLCMQEDGLFPNEIRVKNYSSASPKPGNEVFAHDFKSKTGLKWAFNTVNINDWVPQSFLTVQRLSDNPPVNVYNGFKAIMDHQSWIKRVAFNYAYGKLSRPSNKLQKKYTNFFGHRIYKKFLKRYPNFEEPQYYPSSNYLSAAPEFVLKQDKSYNNAFPPNIPDSFMIHHQPKAYYYLMQHQDNQ